MTQASGPVVGIVMGSDSDWPVMEAASIALTEFGIDHEVDVVSAHRMPEEMIAYGRGAADRGLQVLIAGAGGAAHLPGMLASVTSLPVIGVPVPLTYLDGMAQSENPQCLLEVRMLRGECVVLDRVEGAADRGVLGALKDRPEREVVAVPGGEGDPVEVCGGMQVRGHRLGERPRPPVLERGRVEVVQVQ